MIKAINWNAIEDEKDNEVWKTLVTNFWVPEKIAVSNDLQSYSTMSEDEKFVLTRVFGGLTLLDTLQSELGVASLMHDAATPHERAVLTNIQFMESIHAKSYSNIFSTLCSTSEIGDVFRWVQENPYLNYKQKLVGDHYNADDPIMRKAASVLLESFLFYSGFYVAFYWSSRAKMTNTSDMIRLILRDESLHGYYIGLKLQKALQALPDHEVKIYHQKIYALLNDLYENEMKYTADLYDRMGSGITEDVKSFVRYNGNKALANMGMKPAFTDGATKVSASIMASLNPVSKETHDFFSGSGSSYVIGTVEETTDDDWDL